MATTPKDTAVQQLALQTDCPCCAGNWHALPFYRRHGALRDLQRAIAPPPPVMYQQAELSAEALAELAKGPMFVTDPAKRPMFHTAEDLASWLESLLECCDDGAITGNKWGPAQAAAAAVRALIATATVDTRGEPAVIDLQAPR